MPAPVVTMDVVIAGAGMSGLAAAIAAAEKGARVCVLEKRKAPGGAAAISAGAIWAPTSISRLSEYVPDGNPVLQEILVNHLPQDLAWLASHGLMLSAVESVGGLGEGRNMLGGESGSHDPFMAAMADRAARLGVQFCYQAALVEARRNSSGFEIHTDTGIAMSTKSLILATGGFQGSRQLLTRYLGAERAGHLYLRGLAESAGDGLTVALSLGARTAGDMAAFYGHTMPDGKIPPEQMQPVTPYFARYSVLVNLQGRRFVDEAAALLEEVNPQEGCRQPGGKYFLVFDQHIYATYGINQQVTSAIPAIDRVALASKLGVPVYKAGTLEDLASQLGGGVRLPPSEFVRRLGGARAQAREERLEGGRHDEDEQRVGDAGLHRLRPLHVDLEDDVTTGFQCGHDVLARRPVPVAVDLGPLEQLTAVAQRSEGGPGQEPVVHPVDLAVAWRPGRAGHDVVVVGIAPPAPQRRDDGVLAHARRASDDDEHGAGRTERGADHACRPGSLRRRSSSTVSNSAGSSAVTRMSRSPARAASSSRQACRKRRPSPSGPRRTAPVA